MLDSAEEVDLPGLASFDQSILGLMAELGGEDLVDFYREKKKKKRKNISFGFFFLSTGNFNSPAAAMENGPWIAPSSS